MKIPLRDIPNAPNVMPQGPLDANRISQGEVASHYGNLSDSLQQKTISADSFMAEGQGLKKIGQGISQIAQISQAAAAKELEARIDFQVNEAASDMRQRWANYQSSAMTEGSDPASWREGWEKQLKDFNSGLSNNKALSPDAKQKIELEAMRFGGMTHAQLTVHARKATYERSKNSYSERAQWLIETGDTEGAKAVYKEMAAKQLIYPEQVDALGQQADRQAEWNKFGGMIQADPKTALEQISELKDSESSKLTIAQRQRLIEESQVGIGKRRRALVDDIEGRIESGQLTDPAHIEAFGSGYLTKADEIALESRMRKVIGPDKSEYVNLWEEIETYDFADDKLHDKFFELKHRVMGIPEGWRGKLSERLYKKYDSDQEGKSSPVRTELFSRVKELRRQGVFGDVEKEDGKPKDPLKEQKSFDQMLKVQDDADVWIKSNPSATREEAGEWLKKRLSNDAMTEETKRSWFNPRGWFGSDEEKPESSRLERAREILKGPKTSSIESFDATATAYWPGDKKEAAKHGLSGMMEGGTKDRFGNTIMGKTTVEDYLDGKGDYVTVAMDGDIAKGQYFSSPDLPGVVFRAMDTGGAFTGKGTSKIDIAWRDPSKAKNWKRTLRFEPIDVAQAKEIAAARNA